MIVEYIRYTVEPDQGEAFERDYTASLDPLTRSVHCVDVEIARVADASGDYVVRIRWDSAEGHLEGFRGSPEFREFFTHVRPWTGAIQEMRHYEVLATDEGSAAAT